MTEYGYFCLECKQFLREKELIGWENTMPEGYRMACPYCRCCDLLIIQLHRSFEEVIEVVNIFHKQKSMEE